MLEFESKNVQAGLRLAIDLDCTAADTENQMHVVFESLHPGKFTSHHFEPGPDETASDEFLEARHNFLRNSMLIPHLTFYPDAVDALMILAGLYKHRFINTGRKKEQAPFLNKLMQTNGIPPDTYALLLRVDGIKDPIISKVVNAWKAGITDAVEDNGLVATILSEDEVRVCLIRRHWSSDIQNTPYIRVYESILDYALDLHKYKSSPALFAAHADELIFPENRYKIHRADRPLTTEFLKGFRQSESLA